MSEYDDRDREPPEFESPEAEDPEAYGLGGWEPEPSMPMSRGLYQEMPIVIDYEGILERLASQTDGERIAAAQRYMRQKLGIPEPEGEPDGE